MGLSRVLHTGFPLSWARLEGEHGIGRNRANGSLTRQLASTMVHFDVGFEILPGIKRPAADEDLNDFEVGPVEVPAGG